MTGELAQAGAAIILAGLRQQRIKELKRLRLFELIAELFLTRDDQTGLSPARMSPDQLMTRILDLEGHTP